MFKLGPPVQIAYAVVDVFEVAEKWAQEFGAGPFFIAEHIPVTNVLLRGAPEVLDISAAYGQWGSVMLELVQDHGTGPSVIRELDTPYQTGLHHLAYFVDDLDFATAELEKRGYDLAMSAQAGENRFHFIDAILEMGHFLELYEPIESLRILYERVRHASINWDGSDPLRTR